MFRGKEFSNRIELSRLLQGLLNFGVMGSLQLWGGAGGWVVSGGMGVSPHTHMHMHACAHMHRHVYMYRNCKWPLTWRHPCLACLTCMCMHACMCVCVCACLCVWDTSPHTHAHPEPHPPICHPPRGGGPPESVKI